MTESSTVGRYFLVGATLAVLACCNAGCGDSKPKTITAATSGLTAAEEEATPAVAMPTDPVREARATPPIDAAPIARRPAPVDPTPSAKPVDTTTASPSTKVTSGEPTPPAPVAAADLNGFQVPEGSPEEIARFIAGLDQRLKNREIPGKTQEEVDANLRRLLRARADAAKKIMATSAPDAQRMRMLQVALESLDALNQVGEDTQTEMREIANLLAADKSPKIALQGRMMKLPFAATDLQSGRPVDGKTLLPEVEAVLAAGELPPEFLGVLAAIGTGLAEQKQTAEAVKMFRILAKWAESAADPSVANAADQFGLQADVIESGLEQILNDMPAGKETTGEELLGAVQKLTSLPERGRSLYQALVQVLAILEQRGHLAIAGKVSGIVSAAFVTHSDQDLAREARDMAPKQATRAGLVGKSLVIEAADASGAPYDFATLHKGKVTLVFFWTTSNSQALAEIGNLVRNQELYADKGFAVVGVCLDANAKNAQRLIGRSQIPFENLYSPPGKPAGFDQPAAVAAGVDSVPFTVLINAEGKVAAIHARGEKLGDLLKELLGPPSPPDPAKLRPLDQPPVENTPAPPTTPNPASGGVYRRAPSHGMAFVGNSPFVADTAPAAEPKKPQAEVPAAEEKKDEAAESNPYLADAGLSTMDLALFILDMRDKPQPIRERPGFTEAIVDAADRVLADTQASGKYQLIALEAKFDFLQAAASGGNAAAQTQLVELADKFKNDARETVQQAVRLVQLEQKLLDVEKLPVEQLPALIEEVKKYSAAATLGERHLRLASYAVKAINRLENGDDREKHFAELGGHLAKSEFKRLARYGKKLMTPPDKDASEFIGKPLEIAGNTSEGNPVDWNAYRGKVVLVDFWATWCGPCRAALPHLLEAHEKYKDRGFDVVGISLDKDAEALADFLKETPLPWSTLAGEGTSDLAEKYGVSGIPTMFLCDREGRVVAVAHSLQELRPQLEKLLK